MFDVSYAAAWQLGQLLMLQDKGLSLKQYQWKRRRGQQQRDREQDRADLPVAEASGDEPVPEELRAQFNRLSLLEGVPFSYLVPDERMLPLEPRTHREAIRFFRVDPFWVDCLLDGAFSVGRVRSRDAELDAALMDQVQQDREDVLSGCLIRSEVVAGWPGLRIDAFSESGQSLNLMREARLSENVLLCLFAGEIHTLDIYVKLETLHFGIDEDGVNKSRRSVQGESLEELPPVPVPFRPSPAGERVVDVNALADALLTDASARTSAQLAFAIMEGYDKVRFVRGGV